MLKKLHLLFIAIILINTCVRAEIELNPTHPDNYTVQKGDTLWDISARFLKSPWVWPEVWHANPQIENPHLIYPGDVISLIYLDGKPRLKVTRGHPTVKLSPKGRKISHEDAITTIPLQDIKPFLKVLKVLSEEEVEEAPYVVAIEEGHLVGSETKNIYVRNSNDARYGDAFAIARPRVLYRDIPITYPFETSDYKQRKTETKQWKKTSKHTGSALFSSFWKKHINNTFWDYVDVLGYEVEIIAEAQVVKTEVNSVTTMHITSSTIEVNEGDIIIPLNDISFDAYFQPKAATINDDNIRVVALSNAYFTSGKWQIIAISRGSADGISTGDVFDVKRPAKVIRDEVMFPKEDLKAFFKPSIAKVTLPEEHAANIMVFKTFDHISYAIIVDGNRPVKLLDFVRAP
ncbi:MAG: LysM peptidoglycan-binding domain-containing protein [Marinicellaceae bacterium]